MVGGSTGATGYVVEETVKAIKSACSLPVILFPANAAGVSESADAIFFMSLLNSRDVNYITTNQAIGAPLVYKHRIEPISMAYIVIEPGGAAGWVGDARLIPGTGQSLQWRMRWLPNTWACIIFTWRRVQAQTNQSLLK